MGGADHFRVEREWGGPAEAVAFAREVAERFGTGDLLYEVDITASEAGLLTRLVPYLPDELTVEGEVRHASDLHTDPDLVRARHIQASQWVSGNVGVVLEGPPGTGPQVGVAHPGRPFEPRASDLCQLVLHGKGITRGEEEVRGYLRDRLDACRRGGLLPGDRDPDALLDALVAAWTAQLPVEDPDEYSEAEVAGAPPPPVEVDGVVLSYYGGFSRWTRWSQVAPGRLAIPVGTRTFPELAALDGLWLPEQAVELRADLPPEAAIVLGRRLGCHVEADVRLEPSDEELAALLPHLEGGRARIEWEPTSWLNAAAGGYNAVTVWIGQDCGWTKRPGNLEVSISVNYKSFDEKLGMAEDICRRIADEMGVAATYVYRE